MASGNPLVECFIVLIEPCWTDYAPFQTGSGTSSDLPTAQNLKDLGNEYFKKNDYANALDCYSKAIQTGEKTPEQLSVLYQNRAAVFEKLVSFMRKYLCMLD